MIRHIKIYVKGLYLLYYREKNIVRGGLLRKRDLRNFNTFIPTWINKMNLNKSGQVKL